MDFRQRQDLDRHITGNYGEDQFRNQRRKTVKSFTVRMSFTDRKLGPGTGRSIKVETGSPATAIGKAAREFWKGLDTKERNDARRSGLVATAVLDRTSPE